MSEDLFTMPIINTRLSMTWRPTEDDRETAMQNHDQTLERLKERGGLDWTELDAVLSGERYYDRARDDATSKARVHMILTQRSQ